MRGKREEGGEEVTMVGGWLLRFRYLIEIIWMVSSVARESIISIVVISHMCVYTYT